MKDEWSTGDDALATREEVTTYDPTSQEPEVSGEGHKMTGGRLTFREHWIFLQIGSRPFTQQKCIKGAFDYISAENKHTTTSCGMSSSPPFETNDCQGGFLVHRVSRLASPRLANVSWSLFTSFIRSGSMVCRCSWADTAPAWRGEAERWWPVKRRGLMFSKFGSNRAAVSKVLENWRRRTEPELNIISGGGRRCAIGIMETPLQVE